MQNPDVQEQLLPYLPQERRNLKELISVLTSPQFQQSVDVFQSGLESGQLGELLREFGFDPKAADGNFCHWVFDNQNRSRRIFRSTTKIG